MSSYCLKCRKNTKSLKVVRNKNRRIILLSKFPVCKSKKLKFVRNAEMQKCQKCI